MNERLAEYIGDNRRELEAALTRWLPLSGLPAARRLNEALRYAVFPGGKRLRPLLALAAAELSGASREQGLRVACAVEYLHSSSLVLDDMPGMDDACLRRAQPALHLVYGEGLAVLAAVALLNQSYALLAEAARGGGRAGAGSALVGEAARCVGADGMVGGQALDLELRDACPDLDALAGRDLKTAALMRLMMTAGALARGAPREDVEALAEFGECLGRAYQICDDLLDGETDAVAAGKTAGQDTRHERMTNVGALGEGGARRLAERLVACGVERLAERFGAHAGVALLADAARFVIGRATTVATPATLSTDTVARHAATIFD